MAPAARSRSPAYGVTAKHRSGSFFCAPSPPRRLDGVHRRLDGGFAVAARSSVSCGVVALPPFRAALSEYRVIRTIASGGMGVVVEALHCPEGGPERRVAVKRIHPHLAEQAAFVDAFRAEAELGAQLSHPNVTRVFDFGRAGDTYFLAMEYVDGATLSALSSQAFSGRVIVPVDVASYLARELLAGLVYSHEVARGEGGEPLRVVHRDLCPQNVLLSKGGEVKITDFGIARALREADAAHAHAARGHVAYLAPEQLRGRAVTPSGDLFAVAVMLWELVAGRRLFARPTEAETRAAAMACAVPSIRALRPELGPAWDAFFARALARDAGDRFPSARAMTEALSALPGAVSEGSAERLAALVQDLGHRAAVGRESQDDIVTADL
jgi:eukaryotic-like serine/threonine-protein kinase